MSPKPTDIIQRIVGIETLRELIPGKEIYISPRMFTMMKLLMSGYSYKEIAARMLLTESTIKGMAKTLKEATNSTTMIALATRIALYGCIVTSRIPIDLNKDEAS